MIDCCLKTICLDGIYSHLIKWFSGIHGNIIERSNLFETVTNIFILTFKMSVFNEIVIISSSEASKRIANDKGVTIWKIDFAE